MPGMAPPPPERVNFLRGDRTNEINTAGVGEFRRRTGVLGDIIDSSPTWVGAPGAPYTANWTDRLQCGPPPREAASGAQTYPAYASAQLNRTKMVYVGANDGLLHGFRSGSYNSSSGTCATTPSASCFTNNDGLELLAYMPGAAQWPSSNRSIRTRPPRQRASTTPTPSTVTSTTSTPPRAPATCSTTASGTPGWSAAWVPAARRSTRSTSPTPRNFAETNAASLVKGEWNTSTLTCVGNSHLRPAASATPTARRRCAACTMASWAVIFGNGLGSASGDAGIFVMTHRPEHGAPVDLLLPEHRRRQRRQPQRHLLRLAGGPRR